MGAINGVLVAWGRVPSIIVTLGTLAIYRGVLVESSGAKTVTTDSLPDWLIDLPRVNLFAIGDLEIRVLVVPSRWSSSSSSSSAPATCSFGRRLYAIGSNPDAAQLIGLPAQAHRLHRLRAVAARWPAWRASCLLARFGNITVEAGRGLELQVVAAVVVGGVNIFGGSRHDDRRAARRRPDRHRSSRACSACEISEFWRDALLGLLILLAVASDAVILKRLRRCGRAPT